MSIDSWQDLLDTGSDNDPKEGVAAPDHSSSSTLSTNERQLELNFERFNNLNMEFSSSSDISLTMEQHTNKTNLPSSRPSPLSPLPTIKTDETSTDDGALNKDTTSSGSASEQQNTNIPNLSSNSSHADTFAKWTPPITNINGASLPWLFSSSTYQQQQQQEKDLYPSSHTTSDTFRQKWDRMQQSTNTNKQPLVKKDPIKSHSKEDTLDLIYRTPSTPQQKDPVVFHFSLVDQKQAQDAIMNRFTDTWKTLRSLDLSRQHLTAIHQLDTMTPVLETLIISHNQIKSLSDLPLSLKILRAKSNRLTDIEGFRYLHKLEYLDVCDNALESFDGMGSFYYLKTLMAENNKLKCCRALEQMHGLVKLKLRGNAIHRLNFDQASLYHLETLDVSYNRIQCLETLNGIPKLHELNLDRNEIESIALSYPIKTLRILKLNYNRLRIFEGQHFPNLHTLYLDNNRLEHLAALSYMHPLDTLSIRDQQCGQQMQAHMKDLEGTRKLYLSGIPVKQIDPRNHFRNLEYLEICGGRMEELPLDFALQVPQLRILYLSHNYLQEIRPLQHHKRLQKLVLIDNRFRKLGDLLETVGTLPRLQYLDTRNNPVNSKMYADLIYSGTFKAKDGRSYPLCRYLGPEYDSSWLSREASHYQDLPEHWQRRRNMYRALFITICGDSLAVLDHVPISDEDRTLSLDLVKDHTSKPSL